ncbi:MAG: hypothetical protein IJZ20_02940, partial [Clostridia bacterium]|nr:hypothetical protein [Clostridia bacterium]
MNTENEIVGFESFCEKVQYTVSVGDELTEEMKAHIEPCEECRTFLEQTELVQAELAKMSFESFTKDGKSVADSVMEEIGRQKMFAGGGNTKKTSGVFRHMGLIAACAVIFVMA